MNISAGELTVGIVVAMRHEFDAIRQVILPVAPVENYQYSQVAEGTVGGARFVIIQSGVGTTNGAIGACDLLHHYQPNFVLNLGTAALISDPEDSLQIADVLIGEQHCQWDLDLGGPITTEWGKKRSYVDVLQTNCLFPDPHLFATGKELDRPKGIAHFFTGNSFFVSDAQHQVLPATDSPIAVDMESFAVAQVCARKGVPFLCIRGITDAGRASANQDFYANVQAASQASAEFALQLIEVLLTKED